jgi:tetratricopeptide (TPR) repeat protein
MVGGSGLRIAPAGSGHRHRYPFRTVIVTALSFLATASCVYFNALYNANRLYDQGVKEIEQGRDASGQAALGASIEKAEGIVERSPNSRWADDALRLIMRARIYREEWPEAAEAARMLLGYAQTRQDSIEVAGYLGTAELNLGEAERADSLLSVALAAEEDADRQAELLWNRGRARADLGLTEAADEDFRRVSALLPGWVLPRIGRVRLLVETGRSEEAALELSLLLTMTYDDREERQVVDLVEEVAEAAPEAAVTALAAVDSSALLPNNRADLIKLRGELHVRLGDSRRGRADYRLAAAIAPASRAAAEARLALVQMDLRAVSTRDEFDSLSVVVNDIAAMSGGRRSFLVRDWSDLFIRVEFFLSSGGLGYILAAETARDELGAPRLARNLFLSYAETSPAAVWAPKAILAALDLTNLIPEALNESGSGPNAEQLRQRLLDDYRDSPYVQAFFGEDTGRFSFEELEQGLRRQLERLDRLADQEVRNRRSAGQQSSQ